MRGSVIASSVLGLAGPQWDYGVASLHLQKLQWAQGVLKFQPTPVANVFVACVLAPDTVAKPAM